MKKIVNIKKTKKKKTKKKKKKGPENYIAQVKSIIFYISLVKISLFENTHYIFQRFIYSFIIKILYSSFIPLLVYHACWFSKIYHFKVYDLLFGERPLFRILG